MNEKDFNLFYKQHKGYVHTYLTSILYRSSRLRWLKEEIEQEVWLSFYNTKVIGTKVKPLLARICQCRYKDYNRHLSFWRRSGKYRPQQIPFADMTEWLDIKALQDKDGYDHLIYHIKNLPAKYSKVLWEFAINKKSHKQIAEEFGMGVSTVNVHLAKARKILKESLNVPKGTN